MGATGGSNEHGRVLMEDDLRRVMRRLAELEPPPLHELLCSPKYFGLTTATPLQVAICYALDGLPLPQHLAEHPDVKAAFGPLGYPRGKPVELDILSAIRSGKSLLVAALAFRWSQSCDLSRLRQGEPSRVSVVSVAKDNANVVFSHMLAAIGSSDALKRLLVEPPGSDSLLLRHPTGRHVEVKVVAGARAGSTLVSRWSAGCIFDEYTRMVGNEEGVVNYEDQRAAVLGRLLPGAQIASIGSPYASVGPAHDRYVTHWGKASEAVCIVKAPGWAMNPLFWTPDRCEKLKRDAPDVYKTDCAAEFSSADDAFFTAEEVRRCTTTDPRPVPHDVRISYVAAMDPATRGNAWTLVVVGHDGSKFVVADFVQWVGSRSEPLSPEGVLHDIADRIKPFGLHGVLSDQAMADALRDHSARTGLSISPTSITASKRMQLYQNVKLRLQAGEMDIPNDRLFQADLMRVRRRASAGGATVVLPETGDGRHCDYAPSLVLAMSRWLPIEVEPPEVTEAERIKRELEKSRRALVKRFGQRRDR